MCLDYKLKCNCGSNTASFNFKDNIMPIEVISRLYCPKCSPDIKYNPETMLVDNSWIIEYDMDIAKFAGKDITASAITPDFLFDEGYCTWRGVYPTDCTDSVKEREELVRLSKINQKRYLDEIRNWGINRMRKLSNEGWRKANEK